MATATTEPAPAAKPAPLLGHLPELDGLRGLAIAIVVLYHVPIQWRRVTHPLFSGVDLFFVLSGFLITGILLDSKGRPGYFKNFYMRRTLRIFPLYYGFLFVYFYFISRRTGDLGPRPDPAWFFSYASNYFVAKNKYWPGNWALDHTWSLAVEEQFYLIWPLIVLACNRRTLMKVCAAIVAAALAARVAVALTVGNPTIILVLTPLRIDTLAIGGFVAAAVRGPGGAIALARRARPVAWALGLALAAVEIYDVAANRLLLDNDKLPTVTVGLTAIGLFFGAALSLLVAGAGDPRKNRVWRLAPLRAIGRYSYAIYLFHLPIIRYSALHYMPLLKWGQTRHAIFFASSFAAAFVAAFLSWHLFEKHFLKLKALFAYR